MTDVLRLAALLLEYPDRELLDALPAMRAAADEIPGRAGRHL